MDRGAGARRSAEAPPHQGILTRRTPSRVVRGSVCIQSIKASAPAMMAIGASPACKRTATDFCLWKSSRACGPRVAASPPSSHLSPHPVLVDDVPTTPASAPPPSPIPLADESHPTGAAACDEASLDSASSASVDSVASEPELLPEPADAEPDCSPTRFMLYNHRSNVLHAAVPADPCFLSTVGKRVDGTMLHFRPACGSRAQQLSSSSVLDYRPLRLQRFFVAYGFCPSRGSIIVCS